MKSTSLDYAALMGAHSVDWDAMTEYIRNLQGNGIIRGLGKAVTGSDLTVTVGDGVARADDRVRRFGSSTGVDFTGDPDPSNPRKALIVVDASGSITKRLGTAQVAKPPGEVRRNTLDPDPPELSAGDTVLYEVWLPAGASTISDADVSDRRILTAPHNRYYVRAEEFSGGSGTNADPWTIQSIEDAIQYCLDEGEAAGRYLKMGPGIFRGSAGVSFTSNPVLSNLLLEGSGMGGFSASGNERPWGQGTTIDYTGTGDAIHIGGAGMSNMNRVIFRDFTVHGTSSASRGIYWMNFFRSAMYNIYVNGFGSDGSTDWGIEFEDSFAGQFNSLYIHNCYNGLKQSFAVNSGYQCQLGFIEVDGFAKGGNYGQKGIYIKGASTAFDGTGLMVVALTGGDQTVTDNRSIGLWLKSCRGVVISSCFTEGQGAGNLTQVGIRVDNSQQNTIINPLVTKISEYGFWSFGNSRDPVVINPQLGSNSGVDSPGTGFQGSWFILGEPFFRPGWTGPQGNLTGNVLHGLGGRVGADFITFGSGDTTPTVAGGKNFDTQGTTVTITDFDDGIEGQEISIYFDDGNTTIAHSASVIELKSGSNYLGSAGDVLKLLLRGGVWYETNGLTA